MCLNKYLGKKELLKMLNYKINIAVFNFIFQKYFHQKDQ